jgi:copper homeostasis protein
MELLDKVKRATGLPVAVMIRPRAGGFCYDEAELNAMEADIDAALAGGADGLVFGALDADGAVDASACRRLLARCAGRPAVFHRAFDATPDPFVALEQIIELGFARILTSGRGGDASWPDAADVIRRLIQKADGRIEIMPGGGIRPHNVSVLIEATGCKQVHSSSRRPGMAGVDEETVAEIRRVIDAGG